MTQTGERGEYKNHTFNRTQAALEGEITSHMTTCLEDPENQNRRNGKNFKTIKGPMGAFELETLRDRIGSFEPQIVKKRQTVLNVSLDNKILGLYGLGMSYQDISSHFKKPYFERVVAVSKFF